MTVTGERMWRVKRRMVFWLWAAATLLAGCDLTGAEQPGTFSVAFDWTDPPPREATWVHARVEREEGSARVEIAEAPLQPLIGGQQLAFVDVPHGSGYHVVIEVKAEADRRARTLYFGESAAFVLRPGEHTEVEVELALTAAPSVSDAIVVVERNAAGYVRDRNVTLGLNARGATRVAVANDLALRAGRVEVDLAELTRDGTRYLLAWDLDRGLCAQAPCPDGARSVFVQFKNERGYPSEVSSTTVDLDRSPPDLGATSLSPALAGRAAEVLLVVTPTEPLAEPPGLRVSPENPGFGAFEPLVGGGYVARHTATTGDARRESYRFTVELTDRAGNRRTRALSDELWVDTVAPGLAWGPDSRPSVVRSGEPYTVRFELDEVAAELPVVRVGSISVACAFEGPTRRVVRCTHTADAAEGGGDKAISIEVRDQAGNLAVLVEGSVLYDTLPRCGDGQVSAAQAEECDEGSENSNAPDATCRADCRPRRCGDGIVDRLSGEACDDGNERNDDGCSSDCRSNEACGNGVLDGAQGEACDDANLLSHDGCSSACQGETLSVEAAGVTVSLGAVAYDLRRKRALAYFSQALWEWDGLRWHRVSNRLSFGNLEVRMSYDAVRDVTVIFDGTLLWEWDGREFHERAGFGEQPSPRVDFAMTYVASRGLTLVWGGRNAVDATRNSELWAWDGETWTELLPVDGVAPTARDRSSMAYDPRRDRVVLFSGSRQGRNDADPADTWEWDGRRWHRMSPAGPRPSARVDHAMAYDPIERRTLLWGGAREPESFFLTLPGSSFPPIHDVWEWDGVRWQEMPDDGLKETFFSHSLGDSNLAFYSYASGDPNLTFDVRGDHLLGSRWRDLGQSVEGRWVPLDHRRGRPGPTLGAATSFDTSRSRGVLFAGFVPADDGSEAGGDDTYRDETWVWSGAGWNPLEPEGEAPPARAYGAMAYDPGRGVNVLFGGQVGSAQPCDGPCESIQGLADTWELRGDHWMAVATAGDAPPAGPAAMVFDQANERITMFTSAGSDHVQVWHYEGARWTRASVDGAQPAARQRFAVAYDSVRKRTVLFGGERWESDIRVPLGDTWEWDGTRFQPVQPLASPSARSGHAMTYHATRGRVLLLGGMGTSEAATDAWEWDGDDWQVLRSDLAAQYDHAMLFDPTTHAAVAVGGLEISSQGRRKLISLSRVLRFNAMPERDCMGADVECVPVAALPETCQADYDGDGDGLVGCADPDCYGRCSPTCNPVRMSCALDQAHCGDGACGAAEDCTLCPSDCGLCPSRCGNFVCDADEEPLTCPGDCRR